MKYLYLSIVFIPFFYLNFKIIQSDLKDKKIPNKYLKYLLFLLPLFYVYLFFYFDVNILASFGQVFFALLISFVLYYIGVWNAGDAKYLLVLALYIPHLGIIPFIGNIALLTIAYLFLYFIWFYFGKCLLNWKYLKSLYQSIYLDLSEKWETYKNNKGGRTIMVLFKWVLVFLIVFVSIRISRLYILNSIFEGGGNRGELFLEIITNYGIYVVLAVILAIFIVVFLIRYLYGKLAKFLSERVKVNLKYLQFIFWLIVFLLLVCFVVYEYRIDSVSLIKNLKLIFTYYIVLWIIFRILRYSYRVTFQLAEQDMIDIKDLKVGEIVDKDYLMKMFGTQICLGYCNPEGEDEKEERKDKLLYPDPRNYFLGINNPIDEDVVLILKKIYSIVNDEIKKNKSDLQQVYQIKVLKTFAFSGYIFIGFLLTYFLQDKIFKFLIEDVIFKSFLNL